jgi:hypothetical protein
LQNDPGYAVAGSSGSAWKDPIDTLRILLAARPEHVGKSWAVERGGVG